jgi:hypothetical protein
MRQRLAVELAQAKPEHFDLEQQSVVIHSGPKLPELIRR